MLFIQGAGCDSPFVQQDSHIASGLQSLIHASAGRAIVMVAEKPGVQFLDNPAKAGDARHCRPAFVQQYSLDTWTHTLARALQAARKLPAVDRSRTLVIGHSEGANVALRLSNRIPFISHVAALSGGGPVYLFHMAEFFRKKGLDPETELYPCWSQILQDPRSALYFGHGSLDEQNPVSAFDVLRAELAAQGRTAIFDRVEGVGHAFERPGQQPPAGFQSLFTRVLNWFAPLQP